MTIDDETFETADEAIAAATARLLEDCELWLRDRGVDETQIVRVRELFAELLCERQAGAIAMLEAGATSLQ